MLRRNISTACDGQPNWHSLLIWSILHECMDFALPTLALDILTLLEHLLTEQQMLSLRPRLILTVTDTHIAESTAATDKCRGRGIVAYIFISPDKAEHGVINDLIKRHFLGDEQQSKMFNIGGLRGVATVPVSSQQPHSFHAHHLPPSLVSKSTYFLLRVRGVPHAIKLDHLLVVAMRILHLEGVVGIMNEFSDTNDQALSFNERDAPSKVIIFSSSEDLTNAYTLRHQLANVVDAIWSLRLHLADGNDYYEDLHNSVYAGYTNTPALGQSKIAFSSPNFDRGSDFPTAKAQYNHGEVLVPVSANVNLTYLHDQLTTPQGQWASQSKPTLNAAQRQAFCSALSTVVRTCSLDTTADAMNQLTATLTSSFLGGLCPPGPRDMLVNWITEAALWLQDAEEEDSIPGETAGQHAVVTHDLSPIELRAPPAAGDHVPPPVVTCDMHDTGIKESDFQQVDGEDTRMEQQNNNEDGL